MTRRRRILLALLPLLLANQCGPSPEETGASVLAAAPGVLVVEAVALVALLSLWRRARPGWNLAIPWKGWTRVLVAHLALVALAVASPGRSGIDDWFLLALLFAGPVHVAACLLAWRVGLAWRPERAALWAPVVASVLVLGPAPLMALGFLPSGPTDAIVDVWFVTGAGGWTPVVVAGLLLAEAGLRAARAGRVPPPPPLASG